MILAHLQSASSLPCRSHQLHQHVLRHPVIEKERLYPSIQPAGTYSEQHQVYQLSCVLFSLLLQPCRLAYA